MKTKTKTKTALPNKTKTVEKIVAPGAPPPPPAVPPAAPGVAEVPSRPLPPPAPLLDTAPTPAEIALRAWQLWEQEGRPEGRDVAHWLQAEAQLRQPPSQPGGPPAE